MPAPSHSAGEAQVLLFLGFIILTVLVLAVWAGIHGIIRWHKNNRAPRLTLPVTAAEKRIREFHGRYRDSAVYYVTFETESGERMELEVDEFLYDSISCGDIGTLTYQGTRFQGFEKA